LRLETWETTMERLYGSHNRARPSRIVCQPSDVILWINTPFDTKNFKRKYESLIKLHHFWRWYFLFFGEAVKKKLTDFGQLFCYPKFFKNLIKKNWPISANFFGWPEKSWPKFGVALLFFRKKEKKKGEVEGSLFFCFSSHTDKKRILSVEKTKVTHHLKRVFSQPVEIFFRGL